MIASSAQVIPSIVAPQQSHSPLHLIKAKLQKMVKINSPPENKVIY
jgi:hypothetical protein